MSSEDSHFADRLIAAVLEKRTPLMVGLDPRAGSLPREFGLQPDSRRSEIAAAVEQFCRGIIEVVAPLVAVVKPQSAFFEWLGPAGMEVLARLIQYARDHSLLVILDGKRGDIGSTASAYAEAYLGDEENSGWSCDGLTVNPFLGADSLDPFVARCLATGSGIFVLVRTSNPGGAMLQELTVGNNKVYEMLADHIQRLAESTRGNRNYGSVGAVIGATHPHQLSALRQRMPNTLFLVPGYGAQGATAADLCGAFDHHGLGAIINSSRDINFAHLRPQFAGQPWQTAVHAATRCAIRELPNLK